MGRGEVVERDVDELIDELGFGRSFVYDLKSRLQEEAEEQPRNREDSTDRQATAMRNPLKRLKRGGGDDGSRRRSRRRRTEAVVQEKEEGTDDRN